MSLPRANDTSPHPLPWIGIMRLLLEREEVTMVNSQTKQYCTVNRDGEVIEEGSICQGCGECHPKRKPGERWEYHS